MRRRFLLPAGFVRTGQTAPLRLASLLLLAGLALGSPISSVASQDDSTKAPAETEDLKYVNQGPAKSTEIGSYYFKRKRYKAALSRFQEAVDTDPNYAPAYLGMGRACERLGLNKKALESYRKYLEMLPSDQDAQNAKDVQRAIARLRRSDLSH